MTVQECINCRKPKVTRTCEACDEPVCKNCLQVLDVATFAFLKNIPDELKFTNYCSGCYDVTVAPKLDEYGEILDRAKQAFVFFKTQRKEIPLIRKSREIYRVPECHDRDETILRLAFLAAQDGYNAVIDTEALSVKVRHHAYQTSKWSGSGVGAMVDGSKIERQDLLEQVYGR
ncbi:MAG: hypothetical protein JST80_02155 [Bdellovibrionales bacterium]|nr:hypothetical protein [Bdellovibrionales bacterium]